MRYKNHIAQVKPALFLLLAATVGTRAQITVAVAANVQYAMEELRAEFGKRDGAEVKTVFGASGSLATQIRNGAPFDVFVSADMDFPDSLHKWGFAREKPRLYAYGKIVLWTLRDLDPGRGLGLLLDASVTHIALADPDRAPYGRQAVNALRQAGLYQRVLPKLVYAENVSQAARYVLTGNADVGFIPKSLALAKEMRGQGHWAELDSAAYGKIPQGALVCRYGEENHIDLSRRFLDFLHSSAARTILTKYGYALP